VALSDRITTGAVFLPPRLLIYGPPGVGKTTFGAGAPNPIFLQTENGADVLGAARFPLAEDFTEVLSSLDELLAEDHEYKTLVVDSLDWLERLIWRHTCRLGVEGKYFDKIEDFGYGKGYGAALDYWAQFLSRVERLRIQKRMIIVHLAHSVVKSFNDPESDGWDKYQIKLHRNAAAVCIEASDLVGFANFRTTNVKVDGGFAKRTRAVGSGERVLRISERPAFQAKTRYPIPHDELEFSCEAVLSAIKDLQLEKEKENGGT
jgi:DNA polymerase III delta prime subunit